MISVPKEGPESKRLIRSFAGYGALAGVLVGASLVGIGLILDQRTGSAEPMEGLALLLARCTVPLSIPVVWIGDFGPDWMIPVSSVLLFFGVPTVWGGILGLALGWVVSLRRHLRRAG